MLYIKQIYKTSEKYPGGLVMKKSMLIFLILTLSSGVSFSQVNAVLAQQSNSRWFTEEEVANVNTMPFTGIALDLPVSWAVFDPDFSATYNTLFTEGWVDTCILTSRQNTILKDKYLRIYIDKYADFFDDWNGCLANWKITAMELHKYNFKGIFFDDEQYSTRLWNYPDEVNYKNKTLQEYSDQARLRGRQIMDTVESVWPNVVWLTMHGMAECDQNSTKELLGIHYDSWWTSKELEGSFLTGLIEAMDSTTTLYDGGEYSYTFRTSDEFINNKAYRSDSYNGHSMRNASFLTQAARDKWSKYKMAFATYNQPYDGHTMDAGIMRQNFERALQYADNHFAWMWVEGDTTFNWIADGIPVDWDVAIRGAMGVVPGTDSILKIESPDMVASGYDPKVKVSYNASRERDIIVTFMLAQDPWTLYGSDTITVPAGTDFVYVNVPLSKSTPIAVDAYKFHVFITTHGGGYDEKLAELYSKNVDVITGGAKTDSLTSLIAPDMVVPGSSPVVNVGYSATEDRDIKIRFMLNSAPFAVYGTAVYTVPGGSIWTVDIEVPIAVNTPLGKDKYNFDVRILPHEGLWSERLDEIIKLKVDCVDSITSVPEIKTLPIALQQNYPNPFHTVTNIFYNLSETGFVQLDVYDIQGRLINRLVNKRQVADEYSVIWDGRSENGNTVPEGIYLCRICIMNEKGTFSKMQKMLLLK